MNTPGTLQDARTARPRSPLRKVFTSPVRSCRHRDERNASDSIGRSRVALLTNICNVSPITMPRLAPVPMSTMSMSLHPDGQLFHLRAGESGGVKGTDQGASTGANDQIGLDAGGPSALITPICEKPRAEPLPSTRATRGPVCAGGFAMMCRGGAGQQQRGVAASMRRLSRTVAIMIAGRAHQPFPLPASRAALTRRRRPERVGWLAGG